MGNHLGVQLGISSAICFPTRLKCLLNLGTIFGSSLGPGVLLFYYQFMLTSRIQTGRLFWLRLLTRCALALGYVENTFGQWEPWFNTCLGMRVEIGNRFWVQFVFVSVIPCRAFVLVQIHAEKAYIHREPFLGPTLSATCPCFDTCRESVWNLGIVLGFNWGSVVLFVLLHVEHAYSIWEPFWGPTLHLPCFCFITNSCRQCACKLGHDFGSNFERDARVL